MKIQCLLTFSLFVVTTLSAQISFKVSLDNSGTYSVFFKSAIDIEKAMVATSQVGLTAPKDKLEIIDIVSHNGYWRSRVDMVSGPVENKTTDYFWVGLQEWSKGRKPSSIKKGEELLLFTFKNALPCAGPVEIIQKDDPFNVIPNSYNNAAGNDFYVIDLEKKQFFNVDGVYGVGSTKCK
ncbi:MAG: hypothetical protein AAGJ18_02985 [Bacteroidota bacterium]